MAGKGKERKKERWVDGNDGKVQTTMGNDADDIR